MAAANLDDLSDEDLLRWFEQLLSDAARRYPGEPQVRHYGADPLQVIDLWGDVTSKLWVVSIHGGYFAAEYDRTVNEPLSRRLAAEGMAVANVEYRRAGSATDPADTVHDVRAAIAAVLDWAPASSAVVVTGHSAGGYLTLTGAVDDLVLAAFPLAPVTDLVATAQGGWDDGAIAAWLGEPTSQGAPLWMALQPESIGMSRAPLTILHGTQDGVVPIELTREFVARHPEAILIELEGMGHYEFLDPQSTAVNTLIEALWRIG
jgi:acetyl esterase/lipase